MEESFREKMWREEPELAALTDFATNFDSKLRRIHEAFEEISDTEIKYELFVMNIYNNWSDIIINPSEN